MKFYRSRKKNRVYSFVSVAGLPVADKPHEELVANTVDAAKEKHVPVVDKNENLVHVKVGTVDHPMTEEHWIVFIAIETKQGTQVKNLHPGDKPEAVFALTPDDEILAAYEYCNLHGLWMAEVK